MKTTLGIVGTVFLYYFGRKLLEGVVLDQSYYVVKVVFSVKLHIYFATFSLSEKAT